jgi:riboflavin kinase/FMN adenylyltransferase
MKIFRDLEAIGPLPAPHVGIGNFDGVHLGHRRLLEFVLSRARADSGTAVAMTFDPHPLSILRPDGRPPMITTLEEKIALIRGLGVDILVLVPFTREFASVTAEKFISDILGTRIGARSVCIGTNFHFGRGGRGSIDLLRREGGRAGIEVVDVEIVQFDSRPISSTRIRENILKGSMDRVTEMLGREYAIQGRGVEGMHRGRELGFSTANLATDSELIPRDGVYVTWAEAHGRTHPSVTNIGVRPTFSEQQRVIETHILDYEGGPLYGSRVRVGFCRRIRDEKRFDGAEELKHQISRDVSDAREWFTEHPIT